MNVAEVLDAIPLIAFVILVLAIAVYAVIGTKCPNCARRKTTDWTGEKRPSEVRGFRTEVKWTCRACGETGWSPKARWWSLIP